MRYRVEYADGRRCSIVNNRDELLKMLKKLQDIPVTDVRKIYKNGITESVLSKYKQYIGTVVEQWN